MKKKHNHEIWEAVRLHPLFQGVEQSTALSLVGECEWRHYSKHEIILEAEEPRNGLLLILAGMAEVFIEDEVLEVLHKNELIGFSSLAGALGLSAVDVPATVQVRAVEDLETLWIPYPVLRQRWQDPEVMTYLLTQATVRLRDVYASLAEQVRLACEFGETDAFMVRVQDVMVENLVTVAPEVSAQEVAVKMSEGRSSSVLVMDGGKLVGIITERDIVQRVVAKGKSFGVAAREVMTERPRTISRFAYYYEAISEMLLTGIKHLPVVDGGKTVGIVTLSDLFRKKNASVMKTIKSIEEADEESLPLIKNATYELTETLIKEKVPALSLLEVVTALYDRVVGRVVALALERIVRDGGAGSGSVVVDDGAECQAKFAFFLIGSGGRGEQFKLTDQDHFLVYEDGGDPVYFKQLGCEITRLLEVVGYARCQGGMMASEELWRGSVSQWQERVRQWMMRSTNENLLLAQNFFSYRVVSGGDTGVATQLERVITELLGRSKIFLYRLAQAERAHGHIPELDQPILSLFKMGRKTIELKKEVLFPYHHSLQILALVHGVVSGTPVEKVDALQVKGVFTADFAGDLKAAAEQVLSLYIKLKWKDGGTVLNLHSLSTREKEELILSLNTLRELQGMVFSRFSV
ncbi:DUF294 nucleotidyltransferase-like domain-containing protein [Mesobacillus maritimus]|uniref:DUF294 nucleotidyltransferase-like domain-containing protein n=1 Tax=Mesobacillus maritimus TaxID=1643336 RepID=UPI00203AB72F|nr:DUF294 nucleotidyltransferase-like domain-containing protein [Mesobacillus maritimus]MCM3668740.1 DUF294 nucleotidyltransferase-like domain-containing protein [Mesobacillus maritimus]